MAFPSDFVRLQLPFDSGVGDASDFATTVTAFGGVTTSSSPAKFGSALQLDGAGKYLVASGPALQLSYKANIGVSFWFYTTGSGTTRCLFDWRHSSGSKTGFGFSLSAANTFYLNGWDSSFSSAFGSAISLNTWHYANFYSWYSNPGSNLRGFVVAVNGVAVYNDTYNVWSGTEANPGALGDLFLPFDALRIGRSRDGLYQCTDVAIDDFVVTLGGSGIGFDTVPNTAQGAPSSRLWSRIARNQRFAKTSPTSSASSKFRKSPTFIRDQIDGGRGYIVGTVKEKSSPSNIPLRRKVRLIREFDGRLIRETWSDAVTGNYTFTNIDHTSRYTIVSYDYELNYRAVIADNILPEVA